MGSPKPPIFTRDEEAKLLEQYENHLRKIVSSYSWKRKTPPSLHPDMLQEARLAFLQHIRRISSADDVELFFIHVKYAIVRFLETTTVVHIPHWMFTQEKDNYVRAILRSAENESYEMDDEMLTEVCYQAFLGTLTDDQREMLEMKRLGHTNREVRRAMGIESDYLVSRMLTRLRKRLIQYMRSAKDAV